MTIDIDFPNNWVCDGRELKPKSGASSSNTWIFDGKEIKPKSGASSSNTWGWDGKELKPKSGASSSNTWVVDENKIKPKSGALSSNTYDMDDLSILAVAGKLVFKALLANNSGCTFTLCKLKASVDADDFTVSVLTELRRTFSDAGEWNTTYKT